MEAEHQAWLDLVAEEALEPDLPVCDPHHHLWDHPTDTYLLDELRADTGSGHNVVSTVFVECLSKYRSDGPEAMRPVGETEFVAAEAARSETTGGSVIAGIVSYADLTLGDAVEAVLAAHDAAGGGRFRGIRHASGWDASGDVRNSHTNPPPGCSAGTPSGPASPPSAAWGSASTPGCTTPSSPSSSTCAAPCRRRRWCSTTSAARSGSGRTPAGARTSWPSGGSRWRPWRRATTSRSSWAASACRSSASTGTSARAPPTSEEMAEAWGEPIRWCIEHFGADRCMFESNFPVDKRCVSYGVLWNAFKRIATGASDAEKADLFHDTATRAYRL